MNDKSEKFVYANNIQTKIFMEEKSAVNPYISKKNYIYGYNNLDLVEKKGFMDVLLLLFTSEFPEKEKIILFEKLAIGMINLGPRHPAVRASMIAGVSKAGEEHLLPIGQMVLGGEKNGALEVRNAMRFIYDNIKLCPVELANKLINEKLIKDIEGEFHIVPGFGNIYGGIDEYTVRLANKLKPNNLEKYSYFSWCIKFINEIENYDLSWLRTGLCAAIFCELSIGEREGVSLFQIICSPGIAAQGLEQSHNRITSMPLVPNDQYIYTGEKNE